MGTTWTRRNTEARLHVIGPGREECTGFGATGFGDEPRDAEQRLPLEPGVVPDGLRPLAEQAVEGASPERESSRSQSPLYVPRTTFMPRAPEDPGEGKPDIVVARVGDIVQEQGR